MGRPGRKWTRPATRTTGRWAQSTTYTACYVPDAGAVYMIGEQDTPSSCLESSHVELTFGADTTEVSDHGNVNGLSDDDHPQYVLTDGVRDATDGFAVTGETGVGAIPVTGQGVRMMWYPGKAAFRAGEASGTEWDDANVSAKSVAFGTKVTASGRHSAALGQDNRATGST